MKYLCHHSLAVVGWNHPTLKCINIIYELQCRAYFVELFHNSATLILIRWLSGSRYTQMADQPERWKLSQSQERKPTGCGVEWAKCSLIIGTGYWVQVVLAWSSIVQSGIQSAVDSNSDTLVRILHSAEEDNWSPFDLKIACCATGSKLITTSMYKWRHVSQ